MITSVTKAPVEALASIRIFGNSLDFDALSRGLGIQPSELHRAGERGLTASVYAEDMWCLDSPYPRTDPLEVHLKWLRQALLPHYDYLRPLRGIYEVSSYCGVSVDGDRCQFQVSPEALAIFVELGIDMDISLIFADYSDVESQPRGSTQVDVRFHSKGSSASFQATGGGLDLDGISSALGMVPSEARRSTDLDPSGKAYATDSWSLVARLPRADQLDAHLKWLGMALLPHSGFLRSLKSRAELLVRCDFGTGSDTGGVSISPGGLRTCTELEIPLEFNAFLIAAVSSQ